MLYFLYVAMHSMTYSFLSFAFTYDFRKSGFHKNTAIIIVSSFSV